MPRNSINASMNRLAGAESAFLSATFLAPVVRGRPVAVNIACVRCTLRVLPADFRGWGIFKPVSHACARVVRVPTADDRRRYLNLFPALRLIVLSRDGDAMTAIPANSADRRFQISGPPLVQLAFEGDLFDTITARFDGAQLWFDEIDARAHFAAAAYLRRELAGMTHPARLTQPGLTAAQRSAYALHFGRRSSAIGKGQRQRIAARPQSDRPEAGARGENFGDAADTFRLTYTDGNRHISVVCRHDARNLSTGICLDINTCLPNPGPLVFRSGR